MADRSGNGTLWKLAAGLAGGIGSIFFAFAVNLSKDAQIALDVAKQHGEELLLLNSEIKALRIEISQRTHMRYTSDDAQRDMKYVERRLGQIEAEITSHMNEHREQR